MSAGDAPTDIREKVIDKVTKLLAKAGDPACTEEEAQAFAAKAQALMTQWAIDEAQVRVSEGRAFDTSDVVVERVDLATSYNAADATLLHVIAQANDCRVTHKPYRGKHDPAHATLYGMSDDAARVKLLYGTLLVQSVRLCRAFRVDPYGDNPTAQRRAWRFGFAAGVGQRLKDAREAVVEAADAAAPAGSSSTALVLVEKAALVAEAVGKTRKGRSSSVSAGAYAAGRAAGRRADVGQSAVTE